jgi:hypothetical protein
MTTRIAAAVMLCVHVGCQESPTQTDIKRNDRRESISMSTPLQRPDLDFMGPYNVPRSSFPDYDADFWTESNDVTELTIDEFHNVRLDIVAALSKHGKVYGEAGGDHDFFVYDDKYFDRTQKIELETSERLPSVLGPAVAELQRVLQKHPTWRVMFIGHGHDSQSREQFFVVYPDVVRIRQLDNSENVASAVTANARLRLAHNEERIAHQRQRVADLNLATRSAFAKMDTSDTDVVLVAWFDTVSALDWDWGWEGKQGMSAWVLLRRPIPYDNDEFLQSDTEFSRYLAFPDGAVSAEDEARKKESRQLIHFENNQELQTELVFRCCNRPTASVRLVFKDAERVESA